MLVAESGQVQYFPGPSDLLQWGRDLLVAESNRLVLALAATQ